MCSPAKKPFFTPPLLFSSVNDFFFQVWPTHPSVSAVNLAPTVLKQDLPAVPPVPLAPTPLRAPPFAISVNKTNLQVFMFAFLMLCPQRVSYHSLVCSLTRHRVSGWTTLYLHIASHRAQYNIVISACKYSIYSSRGYTDMCSLLSLDLNVSCSFPFSCLSFQRLVQGAVNRDQHAQTVTTSTLTHHVTLRER